MHVFYLVPTRQHRHQIHFGEHVRGLIDPWMDSPIPASEIRPGMAMTSAARAECTRLGIRWATWSLPRDTSRTYERRRALVEGNGAGKPTARTGRHTWRPVPVLT
jgi:hypothetical protein